MKTMCSLLAATFLSGTALLAAESTTGPSGFPAVSDRAKSKGETGESAECPIKKTLGGKTFCFQNDPGLTKPHGGH